MTLEAKDIIVTVLPRSSRNEVVEENCNYIKVKLKAAPVKSQANKELIKFLAKKFGIAKSQVEILKGLTSRDKLVRIYK